MNLPTWVLISGVFIIGWLLIPAIILHYRLTSVVYRYNEVLDSFLWRGGPRNLETCVPFETFSRLPAWRYKKALRPHEAEEMQRNPVSYADLIGPIWEQYESLHGLARYAFPLILVIIFA